ncbi:hypothetical protein JCM11491_002313 [Sporobolomyces phaffii]
MPTLSELPEDHGPSGAAALGSTTAHTTDSPSASEPCRNDPKDDDVRTERREDGLAQPLEPVTWSRQELREILDSASALKVKGNAEFGHGQWKLALASYREALGQLPPSMSNSEGNERKGKERASEVEDAEATEASENTADAVVSGDDRSYEPEEREMSKLRAILSSNVAACLLKLNRWKDAVKACDDALAEDPDYFKALHRRAMANESIGSWGSLTAALEDFNKLATLPDITPLLSQQVKVAQGRIPRAIEVQQQKEKDEVMGKLKNLGNTVLGKFGFSLDNFKMQEQPGGGYSMQFQQ